MPLGMFHNAVPYVFDELQNDPRLRSGDLETFVTSAAHHLDAVNHLHPFREGNGRTQRVLFDQLAERADFTIDWAAVEAEENIEASQQGEQGMRQLLTAITDKKPDPSEPSRLDELKGGISQRASELDHGDDNDPGLDYDR